MRSDHRQRPAPARVKVPPSNVSEDNGFYCIDNLPAGLLPELAERALIHTELAQPLVAVSIDAATYPATSLGFPELLEEVRQAYSL